MIEFIISLNNQDVFFFNSNEEVAVESTVKVGPFTCTDYRQTQGKIIINEVMEWLPWLRDKNRDN